MSKKHKHSDSKFQSATDGAEESMIGVMLKNFMQCNSYGPHVANKSLKSWTKGQVVWDSKDIEALLKCDAPIETYKKCSQKHKKLTLDDMQASQFLETAAPHHHLDSGTDTTASI